MESIEPVRIPVSEVIPLRKGIPIVVGVIDAGSLVARHRVPHRDHRHKTGYQRPASTPRVNRLRDALARRRVDLPTAVLLNMRDFDSATSIEEEDGRRYLHLTEHLHVVDGQHRIAALERLLEEDADRWSTFRIPFVCMLGATQGQEMEQFYVVNSTAKSVRTDLAYDLLKQQAEADPEVFNALEERGEAWKVRAQAIVEQLVADSPIWQNRVRFSGDPKAATTVGNAGLANSLKQLLSMPFFEGAQLADQVRIVDAYWRGVRAVLGECFDDPTDFTIQKTTGVHVLHALLPSVIERVRSFTWSVVDPDAYKQVLREPLSDLEGDSADGNLVRGVDFWRVGIRGAAGSFSSNAGRRVLVAKIKAKLPAVEIE